MEYRLPNGIVLDEEEIKAVVAFQKAEEYKADVIDYLKEKDNIRLIDKDYAEKLIKEYSELRDDGFDREPALGTAFVNVDYDTGLDGDKILAKWQEGSQILIEKTKELSREFDKVAQELIENGTFSPFVPQCFEMDRNKEQISPRTFYLDKDKASQIADALVNSQKTKIVVKEYTNIPDTAFIEIGNTQLQLSKSVDKDLYALFEEKGIINPYKNLESQLTDGGLDMNLSPFLKRQIANMVKENGLELECPPETVRAYFEHDEPRVYFLAEGNFVDIPINEKDAITLSDKYNELLNERDARFVEKDNKEVSGDEH